MFPSYQNIITSFKKLDLFTRCVIISAIFHLTGFAVYYISTMEKEFDAEVTTLENIDLDYIDIPASLLNADGSSNPGHVEKKEWVEGTSNDKNATVKDDETDVNAVSGDGTGEGDGYSLGFKADKYPEPIVDFDINRYFPKEARQANISQKTVVLLVKIDENGDLKGVKIISEPSQYGFDQAALRVVKRIRFRPGYLQGRPVKIVFKLPIMFVLED
ncbi:MAG: energy transducer TonB [Spirochaetes bacterium]|jgi:protein TonB|nr:energy transducer TonB [Spirochaetota bacterium]